MRDLTICAALALHVARCRNEPLPAVKAPAPEAVSLEQAISTPERFDGVLVRVSSRRHSRAAVGRPHPQADS
jgi:hypothetical protein